MSSHEEYIIQSNYPTPHLPTDVSFCDHFLRNIAAYNKDIAMIDPENGSAITYGDLSIRVECMRNALYRIGVVRGDVMGTYTGNSSDFIIFCIAATSVGAVVTPINPAYKTYEVEKYFKEANMKWAVTEERYFQKLSKSIIVQNAQATIVLDSARTTSTSFGFQGFLSDEVEKATVERAVIGDDPAFIFFSSGTTSRPKGVILNNRSLIATIEIVRIARRTKSNGFEMVVLDGSDVVYGVLPYFHAGGLLTAYCMLVQGVQLIINRKFDGAEFLETIKKYKVTTLNLVPPVLNFLADSPLVQMPDLSSLKHIFVGAARVEANLLEKVKQKLQVTNIVELYGLTEAGAVVFMHPAKCKIRPGSCGILLPGVVCKIVDIHEKTLCGPMQSGEVWIRTATMMSSYLKRYDNDNAFIQNGWFQTGDIGYYDEERFLYISGRTKEMIKVRGWQVSPYEIEEAILQLPQVEQCAVIGIADEAAGESPRAYVVLRKGAHLCADDIHKIIEEKLASYKRLTGGIEFINNMPMTASGKIARNELLANFSSNRMK